MEVFKLLTGCTDLKMVEEVKKEIMLGKREKREEED